MQACDRCHARKTRCDRRIPLCGACEKAGTQCLHTDKLRKRNVPRGYIDSMETRVQELTRENARLQLQLQLQLQRTPVPAATNPSPLSEADLSQPQPQHAPPDSANHYSSRDSHDSLQDNVFARELGFLSLAATGETRYLGSGCGMSLANLIGSVISAQSGMSLPVQPSVSDGPVLSRPPTPPPTDCHLPPLADAETLIQAYFEHTHITFPLLHEPSFMETVDKAYGELGFYDSHPFEAFTIDMVLAIGSSNFNRLESSTKPSAHYARAQAKAQQIMTMDGLKILRAILLISHHATFSNLGDTSASIWHLVGIGARLCFEQGLHLEQGCLTGGVRNFSHGPDTVVLEEEMKKRCFWCLYNLDRVVSFTLGRPLIIRDEEIDVSLPSHLADKELSADRPVRLPTSPASLRQTPFLHLIRIRRLSGQILNIFHNSRQSLHIALEEKKRIRQQFHQQLLAWKEDTKNLDLAQGGTNKKNVSSFLTKEWYDAVYHNAILLLYRPSPYLPHPTMVLGPEGEEAELTILFNSAKASIESYSALRDKRRLNHSWITLHGVFLAGVAYIYCVGRLLRDPAHDKPTLDLISIIEVTRACSNILVAICERWNVSRRSCDLFNKLSNAVIMDALDATSRSRSNGQDYQHPTSSSNWDQASEMGCNSPLEHGSLGATPQLDQILDMDEFRHYASTLGPANMQESPFPGQFLLNSPRDWLYETPFSEHGTFDSSI